VGSTTEPKPEQSPPYSTAVAKNLAVAIGPRTDGGVRQEPPLVVRVRGWLLTI
jgi:hypothetical protein